MRPPEPGALVRWYCCPICGERFDLPVDSEPRNDEECEWLWRNIVLPLVLKRCEECQWPQRRTHA